MIVFLTLSYVVLLAILMKLKVVKPTLAWKLSPMVWMALLFVGLFIPMQAWAPAGSLLVADYSVQIVPNVTGQVIEVPVEANVPLSKGDVLYLIDPVPYQAALDQVAAKLELAKLRESQSETLAQRDAGSRYELQQYQATVKQLEAGLSKAEYDLANTVVRAPSDGYVTNVTLRPGARVAAFPIAQTMAFVETSERLVLGQILQGYLRFVKPGQSAEVTFKMFPGRIASATVREVIPATALGQAPASGVAAKPRETKAGPFFVRLDLDDEELLRELPSGAVGEIAIYTDRGSPTHVIRKVMIRMNAYMNFVDPS